MRSLGLLPYLILIFFITLLLSLLHYNYTMLLLLQYLLLLEVLKVYEAVESTILLLQISERGFAPSSSAVWSVPVILSTVEIHLQRWWKRTV